MCHVFFLLFKAYVHENGKKGRCWKLSSNGKPKKSIAWFQVVKKAFMLSSKENFDNKYLDMVKVNSPMHYSHDFY
jgi:hypothetical protein